MITPIVRLAKNRILSQYIRASFPASKTSIAKRRPVFGVGENDADYVIMPKIDGKLTRCPSYRSWHNVIRRANDPKLHALQPTYSGVSVCGEWLRFMTFRDWWLESQVDSWDLDKDILSLGSKIYSPETCIFVPQWINLITGDCRARRGDWPIGVSWHQRDKIFQAHCKDPVSGKVMCVGRFRCPNIAHAAWRDCKLDHIEKLKPLMDEVDERIYDRILFIIKMS